MRTRSASQCWTPPPRPRARRVGWRPWIVGGLALAGIGAVGAIGGRRDEIGMAMGFRRHQGGRLGWQIHAGNVHDDSRLGNRDWIVWRAAGQAALAPHGRWTGCGHHIRIRVEHDLVRTGRLPGSGASSRSCAWDSSIWVSCSQAVLTIRTNLPKRKNADEPEETVESTERTEVNA